MDADHPMSDKARSAGIERFLLKPVSHEELEKSINSSVPASTRDQLNAAIAKERFRTEALPQMPHARLMARNHVLRPVSLR